MSKKRPDKVIITHMHKYFFGENSNESNNTADILTTTE